MGMRISSIAGKDLWIADHCCYAAPTPAALLRPLEDWGRSLATPTQGHVSDGSGVSHLNVTDSFVRKTHETHQDTSGGAPYASRSRY
jgi:hypothetical protein